MTSPVPLDFALVGFSKCGTTTLSAALAQHPDVQLPIVKEPWFFSWDEYEDHWDWYGDQYPAPRRALLGDDSTTYSAHQFARQTAERLHRHYPQLRVLVVARDPVDRIESAYREAHHSSHRYGILTPFGLSTAMTGSPGLVEDSRYGHCLQPYIDLFPPEQIKVVFLEQLEASTDAVIRDCLDFIGASGGDAQWRAPHLNSGSAKYRDTRAIRTLRRTPVTRGILARADFERQERWLRASRLRRPAERDLRWDAAARRILREVVLPDAQEFLERHGEGVRWNRLAALAADPE